MEGRLIGGKYRVRRRLGQGGMGSVWAAEHADTQRVVAVKVLGDAARASTEAVMRFSREARAAGKLQSDHIVEVLDAGVDPDDGAPYLVMEQLVGESISELAERLGPMPVDLAVRIAVQACNGLSSAHEAGVVHRDIKPANLFLASVGERRVVKILDFGIAKLTTAASPPDELTRTGNMLGSPKYMSPEQIQGLRTLDQRTDVFSLGVVLFRLLAGNTPHEDAETHGQLMIAICTQPAPPVTDLAPWVAPGLVDVIARALAIDPEQRFATAVEMCDALKAFAPTADPEIRERDLRPLDSIGRSARTEPPPPAPALADSTGAVESTSAGEAPRPGRLRLFAGVAAAGAVAAALAVRFGDRTADTPAPAGTEQRARATASQPASQPGPSPTVVSAQLLVPPGASVEVGGGSVENVAGTVTLQGQLGSVLDVRVSEGRRSTQASVALTTQGAVPSRIALPDPDRSAAARRVQPRATSASTATPNDGLELDWPDAGASRSAAPR